MGIDDNHLLLIAIDAKMKQHGSLVHILMNGPDKIYDDTVKNENEQKNEENEQQNDVIQTAEDRWDYDIKLSDNDEQEDEHDDNLLSVAIDCKLKQNGSLVDVLLEGPNVCKTENENDENIENEAESPEKPLDTPEIEDILLAELEYEAQIESVVDEKKEDRWDYDIKLSDDEQSEQQNDNNLLSVVIDSKLKQCGSLVDILMQGPNQIHKQQQENAEINIKLNAQKEREQIENTKNESNENNESQQQNQESKSIDRWDYDIKLSDDENNNNEDDMDDNLLSIAIDAKMKQNGSLIDVLIKGPEIIQNEDAEKQNEDNMDDGNDKNEECIEHEIEEKDEKKELKLATLINKIKAEDRWDYDIKLSDDEQHDNDNDDNLLSIAIDSKFKRGASLVDILMEGPNQIICEKNEETVEQNTAESKQESEVTDDKLSENEEDINQATV